MIIQGVKTLSQSLMIFWREQKLKMMFRVILDRGDAIQSAIQSLGEEEALLIAGKGHETTQVIGSKTHPFSDIEVALECSQLISKQLPKL